MQDHDTTRNVPRLRRPVSRLWGVAAVLVTLAGCGGDTGASPNQAVYPVTGKVLLASGKPLTEGKVVFLPKQEKGLPAQGEIGADGAFTLRTVDGREGAAAGEYGIKIVPGEKYHSKKTGSLDPKSLPFSPKYLDEDAHTGLTATVKAGPTDLEPLKLANERQDASARRSD